MDPGPPPVASVPPVPFELRRALIDAQVALLSGDRPRELAAYVDAVRRDPAVPTVRLALLAIGRERLAAGDRFTAGGIADELTRLAPDSRETALLQKTLTPP